MIAKAKNTISWIYVISDLKRGEIIETFDKKNCQKQIKENLALKM